MNIVLLHGSLSSEPRQRELPSGDAMVTWEVTTVVDDQRLSVPVVWFRPPKSVYRVHEGDAIVVAGRVRRRFWQGGRGPVSSTEVVAERWARADRADAVAKLVDRTLESGLVAA
jgi:single-strand DNA-binding protein